MKNRPLNLPAARPMLFRLLRLFMLVVCIPLAGAQTAFAQTAPAFSQRQLEQMLAPIALYPDHLLFQILAASTRPDQLAQAAHWAQTHPHIEGDDALRAAQAIGWDPSVQALVAFPQLLARLTEDLAWTRSLGAAFVAQEPHVMDAVQVLRQRAQAAGALAQDERSRIVQSGPGIVIEPVQPLSTYVPYYDPWIAYGPWHWSAYPPVRWAPWAVRRVYPSIAVWPQRRSHGIYHAPARILPPHVDVRRHAQVPHVPRVEARRDDGRPGGRDVHRGNAIQRGGNAIQRGGNAIQRGGPAAIQPGGPVQAGPGAGPPREAGRGSGRPEGRRR